MTTNYHTVIAVGASNHPNTVNGRLGTLDAQITLNTNQLGNLNLTTSTLVTRANGGETSGSTNIDVDSTTGFQTGDTIGYTTANGYEERTATVASGTQFTVAAIGGNLADNAIVALIPPSFSSAAAAGYSSGTYTLPQTIAHALAGTYNVKRYGAVGDGTTDDTLAIQAAIDDAVTNQGIVVFPPGTYLVSKNSALSGFPLGDQPCLSVHTATNVKLIGYGATLHVDKHAQGILEIQNSSSIMVEGLAFQGYGSFPALDGTTGRGEKGTNNPGAGDVAGYWTTGGAQNIWALYRNNVLDTSAYTGGGVVGAWGTFGNGGYIGNVAYGLLINKGCDNVTVKNCESYGFNYAAFGVGHHGDTTYPVSTNITFDGCFARDCYARGIHIQNVNGGTIINCKVRDIGHPNMLVTDTYPDPGYGIVCQGTNVIPALNIRIIGNDVRECVRKGIDAHTGLDLTITNNKCYNCWNSGIYVVYTSATAPVRHCVIAHNNLELCGWHSLGTRSSGIWYSGIVTTTRADIEANTIIAENVLLSCGGRTTSGASGIILCQTFERLILSHNIIKDVHDSSTGTLYGILCGSDATNRSYNLSCIGNIVDANADVNLIIGMQINFVDSGVVANNVVMMEHAAASIGVYLTSCINVAAMGNVAYLDTVGTPIAVTGSTGPGIGNWGVGGSIANAGENELKSPLEVDLIANNVSALIARTFTTPTQPVQIWYMDTEEVARMNAYTTATDGASALVFADRDMGNGATNRGAYVRLARNTNGTNTAAGFLQFQAKDGTSYFLWVDVAGKLRINTVVPYSGNDVAGTVVGTQIA